MQAYSDPSREKDPHALPDLEIFYVAEGEMLDWEDNLLEPGIYWWVCLPGCLPDSDPNGPFATEDIALTNAREELNSL
jgi:hypothetical protein